MQLARWLIAGRAGAGRQVRLISKVHSAFLDQVYKDPRASIMSSSSSPNMESLASPRQLPQHPSFFNHKTAVWKQLAAKSAEAAASAAAQGHELYLQPGKPGPHPIELSMAELVVQSRQNIIRNIQRGKENLADMHIPLTDLQLYQRGQLQEVDDGEQYDQLYSLEELEQQAAAAWDHSSRGLAVPAELMPKVPDGTRPFTITMKNGLDSEEYVVAHYEPKALFRQRHKAAAVLADIFHGRSAGHLLSYFLFLLN